VVVVAAVLVVLHLGQDRVEALVALLGLSAVPLEPARQQVEDLCFEVARPPLCAPSAGSPGRRRPAP
jgi:hypothetical protein